MAFLNALARAAKAAGMRPDEYLRSFSDKWKGESNAQSSLKKHDRKLAVSCREHYVHRPMDN